jgi:hypothetical protein
MSFHNNEVMILKQPLSILTISCQELEKRDILKIQDAKKFIVR